MAKLLKLRRGTTSQHNSFTGAEGEVTIDTTKDTAVVHDGSQAGGRPLAREDMSNVSSSSIAGRLGADSIAVTKIAGGTLPSDVKVNSANITDGSIVNSDINSSAAIAGTKVSPNFGSQAITTTGTITSNDITIQDQQPRLNFVDNSGSPNNPDYLIQVDGGQFVLHDSTNSVNKMVVQADGHMDVIPNCDFANGIDVSGNITCTGSIDGRDVAADGTKLDGIESGATGDQTAAEIRTLVESASDSNVFTNADHTKLNGIESGATADQSASEILTAIKTVDGSGSGLDADLLDGMHASSGTNGNTIVQRNASGYVFANYFNTTANDVTSGVTKIMVETGNDNYIRHGDAGAVRSFLNVENGATADQSASEILTLIKTVDGSGSGLDADTLDTLSSSSFLRSDTADTAAGDITFTGGAGAVSVGSASDIRIAGGTWTGEYGSGIKIQPDPTNSYFQYQGVLYFRRGSDGSNRLNVDSTGNLTASGNVTAYSDARLKTNVNTINDALSIVGKLRGVSFDWKENGKRSIGVIAQEVEEVLPELVLTNQDVNPVTQEIEEIKSVDYGKIVGVLINAINELKAEVDELKGGK